MSISKKNVVITLVIKREMLRRVDAIAGALEITRSELIRQSIESSLENYWFLSRLADGEETRNQLVETLGMIGYRGTDEHGRLVGTDIDFDELLSEKDWIRKKAFGDEALPLEDASEIEIEEEDSGDD